MLLPDNICSPDELRSANCIVQSYGNRFTGATVLVVKKENAVCLYTYFGDVFAEVSRNVFCWPWTFLSRFLTYSNAISLLLKYSVIKKKNRNFLIFFLSIGVYTNLYNNIMYYVYIIYITHYNTIITIKL